MSRSRVVIAPNWIGDTVMSLPVLRAIRRAYPKDLLIVLARRGPAAVYRCDESADEVIVRAGFLRDILTLRGLRAEEIWLLPNSFRSGLLAFLSGSRERIGYATDRRGALLTHALAPRPPTHHQLRDYDRLLESRGIAPDLSPPRLGVPSEAARGALRALSEAGIAEGAPLVLLAPGAAFGPTKRWAPERYARLADLLSERGFACAAVIGPGETSLARQVTSRARYPLPVLGEDLDPAALAALLSRARLVVANDSGPMHLAAAVGAPVVAFFGPTDPGRTSPTGSSSRALDRYVFCSPCYLKKCPYGHECMKEISVEDALAAVESLLRAAGPKDLVAPAGEDPSLRSG